jgi:hypothetical protein
VHTFASSGSNSSNECDPAETITSGENMPVNYAVALVSNPTAVPVLLNQAEGRGGMRHTLLSTSERKANGILRPTLSSAMTRYTTPSEET